MQAALFDMDGTILDANLSIRETMNRVLAEAGQPTFGKAELEGLVGHPLRVILSHKCKDPEVVERMAHRYRSTYTESGWVLADLYPGVRPLLEDLRRRGVKVGLVTSKGQGEAEMVCRDLGILDLFDVVVGDDDVRALKPDAAPVLEACQRLGVPPGEAAMVGDTRFDILSGRAAGSPTIGVLWGFGSRRELEEAGADALAATMRDLGRMLR